MKLQFKTVKELCNFITQEDYDFVGKGYTHIAFRFSDDLLEILQLTDKEDTESFDSVDDIYGGFGGNEGYICVTSTNDWNLSFEIEEKIKLEKYYILKIPDLPPAPEPEPEEPEIIDL